MSTLPDDDASTAHIPTSSPQWHTSFSESLPVEITVGEDRREYYIHKDKLCSKSGYFKARINFYEIDPQDNTMKAHLSTDDGHDAKAFSIISEWFYDGPRALSVVFTREKGDYNANRRAQLLLTRVYIEADKLIIPQLKNDVIDTIIEFSTATLPSMKSLKLLKDTLPLDTPLERYYLDCLVFWLRACPEFLHFNVNGWHQEANEYLQQDGGTAYLVLKRVCGDVDDLDGENPNYASRCTYHEHSVDAPVGGSPGASYHTS